MSYRRSLFCIVSALVLCSGAFQVAAQSRPWWDDFPIIVETGSAATAHEYSADIGFNAAHNDPNWGLFGLYHALRPDRLEAFSEAGMKSISYYETFGQAYCYIAEIGPPGADGVATRPTMHWNWQLYPRTDEGVIAWIGMHNYWDDEEWARPYTRTHPDYGGPALTYPDGTVATGWNGPDTDPRNSRIYDAACSKSVLGDLSIEWVVPEAAVAQGVTDGLVQMPNGDLAGLIQFQKDSACPAWNEYVYQSARFGAERGSDGMWTDNFSPWDSFGNPPIKNGFGDWSVARFRDWLQDNLTPDEIEELGVTDVDTFDVRAALRAQVVAWGGDDTNLNHHRWRDNRWLGHELWIAYAIHKRQTGTAALSEYYHTVKQAAADAGVDEYFIAGNDIPNYALGWPRGDLDMVSTEMSAGWQLLGGPRGIMYPPAGRFGPVYNLAREHARSRFVNIWFYVDEPENQGRTGLGDALNYEMLASHTLPMFHPDWGEVNRIAGSAEGKKAFAAFVQSVRPVFGGREPVHDIGLFYSSSSALRQFCPGGFNNHAMQPHQFAFYGWGTALTHLHCQYRAVPEWKLTPETLAGLQILIVPNADCMEPELVTDVIAPWVENGGRLIVTADSAVRLGEAGLFHVNPEGSPFAALHGHANVQYVEQAIGIDYYGLQVHRPTDAQIVSIVAARAALLPEFAALVGAAAADRTLAVVPDPEVPVTAGITAYAEESRLRFYVDVNNVDIDHSTDTLTPTPTLTFTVNLPAWMEGRHIEAEVVSPDPGVTVGVETNGSVAFVELSPVTRYASVVLEAQEPRMPVHGAGTAAAMLMTGAYAVFRWGLRKSG